MQQKNLSAEEIANKFLIDNRIINNEASYKRDDVVRILSGFYRSQLKEKEDVEKLAEDLMIYINDEAQRVAKTLNLDDYGKDLLHENMDMAYNEWKRKNFAGYNAGTK